MSTDAKKLLTTKRSNPVLSSVTGLSTGSTLLNLACSDSADYGLMKGAYYLFVGDSTSGKTWINHQILAEACRNKAFKDHRIIYDDVENGALMDVEQYFGKALAQRIGPPAKGKKGEEIYSTTVQSFYYGITDIIDAGKSFVYVLDSQDGLDSDQAIKKFEKQKKAYIEDDEAKGSMGDGKAKYHSENLRGVVSGVRDTDSILIFISQTRENLDGFSPKTRSGGKAMRFYATLEIWTSVIGQIKKMINGKERTLGVKVQVEVKKNRFNGKIGKDRAIVLPIYHGLGVDEVGSCVDYLISEKHWLVSETEPKSKVPIYDANEVMLTGTRNQIVDHIEKENLEGKLSKLVEKVWLEIEEKCQPNRKRRYE